MAPLLASAFTVPPSQSTPRNPSTTSVFLSDSVETNTNTNTKLVLTGNNIDLTPALEDYAQKRIGGLLDKLGGGGLVRECDIHLSVSKNPKVGKAKITLLGIAEASYSSDFLFCVLQKVICSNTYELLSGVIN